MDLNASFLKADDSCLDSEDINNETECITLWKPHCSTKSL